jgi:hypothetical protein
VKRYIWAVLIWIDQGFNVLLGPLLNFALKSPENELWGHPDETLSSVMGKQIRAGRCKGCKVICWILNKLDPRPGDHCENAIEDDRKY